MRVLLDTCALAEIPKPAPDPGMLAALAAIPDEDLFVSVITVGEVVKGIGLLAPGKKKDALSSWLNGLETHFSRRILGVDAETGRIWGELTARAQLKGLIVPAADGLIAATALRHGLHLMTRNEKDFRETGVLILNPWQSSQGPKP